MCNRGAAGVARAQPAGGTAGFDPARMRQARVLVAGLGNIGSYLALLLASLVGFIRLVDRGRVGRGHSSNQAYQTYGDAASIGMFKVDAIAARLRAANPALVVETRAVDLDDLPLGDVADVHVCCGGLDSLLARMMLISQRAFPLGVPVIDGGVGAPLLGSVRVYLPGSACLECSWSERHYRTVSLEFPCAGGGISTADVSPALLGSTVAGLMAAEAVKLLTGNEPAQSHELACDLLHGRFLASRLTLAAHCRHDHEVVGRRVPLGMPFAEATVADLLATAREPFGRPPAELEFRRLTLAGGPFGAHRFASPEMLEPYRDQPLSHLGLTPRDYVRVRASGRSDSAMVVLEPQPHRQEQQP